MNEQKTNPTHVRVTSEPQCEIHGWPLNSVQEVAREEINVPDRNGFDIYVLSNLRGHDVYLSDIEYELVETKEPA